VSFRRAHGITFRTELDLPDLRPAPSAARADADIALADLSEAPGPTAVQGAYRYVSAGDDLWFEAPGVARYRISGGRRLQVDPDPSGGRAWLPILTGTALAALAVQRGLLPLHAGAVEVEQGRAVAFGGPSGVGKSTLAAALLGLGLPLLTDDLLVLHEDGRVFPGLARIKLWRDTLERIGVDAASLEPVLDARDKYFLPLPHAPREDGAALSVLYLLADAAADAEPAFARLPFPEAAAAVLDLVYRPELLPTLNQRAEGFRQATELARALPVFRYTRPRNAARIGESAERLAAHAAELG